jgi:uncharacterized membrane protein
MLIRDISTHRQYIAYSLIGSILLTILSLLLHGEPLIAGFVEADMGTDVWHIGRIAGCVLNAVALLLIGWGIFKANESFSISRHRSNLPYVVYLLLAFSNPVLQAFSPATVVAGAVLAMMVILFNAYQRPQASEQAFWMGMLFGMVAIFWNKALLYAPLFLIGLWLMRSMSGKAVIGLLIGVLTPFWLEFGLMALLDKPFPIGRILGVADGFGVADLLRYGIATQANLILTLLVAVVAGGYILAYNLHEKVRTQAYLSFVVLLSFASGLFCVLDAASLAGHIAVLYISTTFALANVFIRMAPKPASILFVLLVVAYLSIYAYSLWNF